MRQLILSVIFVTNYSIVALTQVQGGQHQKLFDLFAFEKYESCAYKAEIMSENDKYRRDSEVYLYLAMCFFEISRMDPDDLDEEYKNPLVDAMKYAAKYYKKDKKKELYDTNKEFLTKLKASGIARGRSWYNKDKARKAASIYNRIIKFDPDDNVRFMKGVCDLLALNSQGGLYVKQAMAGINKNYRDAEYRPDRISEPLLIEGFMIYADHLLKVGQEDSAKATIIIARDLLADNKDLERKFNDLHGIENKEEDERPKNKKNGMKMVYEKHTSEIPDSLKPRSIEVQQNRYRRQIPK